MKGAVDGGRVSCETSANDSLTRAIDGLASATDSFTRTIDALTSAIDAWSVIGERDRGPCAVLCDLLIVMDTGFFSCNGKGPPRGGPFSFSTL